MLLTIVSVIYVLVAIAMIVLILMQRGAGAAAGSGFGAGASATVFGARGSANFLSTSTKWLAVVFFAMSLGMAWNASRHIGLPPVVEVQDDELGAMGEADPSAVPTAPSDAASAIPTAPAANAPADGAVELDATPVENEDSTGGDADGSAAPADVQDAAPEAVPAPTGEAADPADAGSQGG